METIEQDYSDSVRCGEWVNPTEDKLDFYPRVFIPQYLAEQYQRKEGIEKYISDLEFKTLCNNRWIFYPVSDQPLEDTWVLSVDNIFVDDMRLKALIKKLRSIIYSVPNSNLKTRYEPDVMTIYIRYDGECSYIGVYDIVNGDKVTTYECYDEIEAEVSPLYRDEMAEHPEMKYLHNHIRDIIRT